jgi:ubiquinol-cytochrome c reductase cytochrome c subunit
MNRNAIQYWSLLVLGVAIASILAGPRTVAQTATVAQKSEVAPAGNVDNGKRIFKSYGCYQCHGLVGQGGGPAGPRIGPPPLQLKAFTAYCRQPRNVMPPYTAKVVSDAEMADIYAFLQTMPKPPALNTIPLLEE